MFCPWTSPLLPQAHGFVGHRGRGWVALFGQGRDTPPVGRWLVLYGAGCDRVSDLMLARIWMWEGGRSSSRSASSLPWPPSWCYHHHPLKAGLLGGRGGRPRWNLGAVAKGGIARRRRYCSSSGVGLARVGRRVVGLRGLDARAHSRACSTLDVRDGGGRCSAPPSRSEERLLTRRSSSPRNMSAITVKLTIV